MASPVVELLIRAKNATGRTFTEVEGAAKTLSKRVSGFFSGLAGKLAGVGLAISAGGIAKYLFDANREFQDLTARLRTFSDSGEQAAATFRQLQQLAVELPFELKDIVDAYITLRSAGITPTMDTLRLFSDTAASFGLNITQMAAAVRSATTGEFEPLKQFGVVAHIQGNQIAATYQGVTTVIERNATAVTNYLETVSKNNYAGASARQINTLGGAVSNLQDTFFALATSVGEGGASGAMSKLIHGITDFAAEIAAQPDLVAKWITVFLAGLKAVGVTLYGLIKIAFDVGYAIGLQFDVMVQDAKVSALGIAQAFVDMMNRVILTLDQLPGVHIGLLDGFQSQIADAMQSAEQLRGTMRDTVTDIGHQVTASVGAIGGFIDALNTKVETSPAAAGPGGLAAHGLATGVGAQGPQLSPKQQAAIQKELDVSPAEQAGMHFALPTQIDTGDALATGGGAVAGPQTQQIDRFGAAFHRSLQGFENAVPQIQSVDDALGELAAGGLANAAQGFVDMFAAIGSGQNVFGSIAKAVKNSIADTAKQEAQMEEARGVASLARGLFPPEPLALAAAAKHFAAAALFATIGGAVGGNGGGGGGGSGANNVSEDSRTLASVREGVAGTIVVHGGIINLNDPRQAQEFADALNTLGRQGRVEIVSDTPYRRL